MDAPFLVPAPRQLTVMESSYTLPNALTIAFNHASIFPDAKNARQALGGGSLLLTTTVAAPVMISISADTLLTQAYTLTISAEGIRINGSDGAGVYYGVCTLAQLCQQYGRTLPMLSIMDYPDIARRGVMLDISRDRVPTLDTLFMLVRQLAALKINELQLYIEHTFTYPGHEEVWQDASPLNSEDLLELQALCHAHHIALVPNQNSLGHMERWLKHPRYNALAETPDGFVAPWQDTATIHPPTTLNPLDPRSLALVTELYDALLPHFDSPIFNIGGDEPWELGKGASQKAWDAEPGRVYVDFLKQLHHEAAQRGRTVQFWADIIVKYPDLVEELPKDAIAMIWGYEATEPNEGDVELIASSGLQTYIVPGTSSWNSLTARTSNAIDNLRNSAILALKYGSIGYLITEWGDNGHWQALSASWLGFTVGAAFAWCYEANKGLDVARALSAYVFQDASGVLGKVAVALGDVYRLLPISLHNSTFLFRVLQMSDAELQKAAQQVAATIPNLGVVLDQMEARIVEIIAPLAQVDPDSSHNAAPEFAQAGALMRLGIARTRHALGMGAPLDAAHVAQLIATQRSLWLNHFREGGLADSLRRFEHVQKSAE